MFDLTGRVALVTGAGQGVGAGIARLLGVRGAHVVVNDIRPERAGDTVAAITASGGRASVSAFDVTEHNVVAVAVADIVSEYGSVDILVNNAGNGGEHRMAVSSFRESDPATWRAPIDVNLFGVMNCCHAVINHMVDRGHGRIVTISSGAGTTGLTIGVSPYAAGKGGGISFMRHLAIENARFGVTANTIAIGLMDVQGPPSDVTKHLARSIPVGRLGRAEDIGALCVYLASDEASWMTAQTVGLNGGNLTS